MMSGRPQPVGVGVVPEVVRRTHPGLCWLWGVCLRVCVWVGACCRVLGRCALVVACVACASSGVWRGVGCGGWVGCDLYSGREHHLIVFMRGMPGDR